VKCPEWQCVPEVWGTGNLLNEKSRLGGEETYLVPPLGEN